MRIAVISTCFSPVPPEKYGGTEVMVDNLARGLHAAGQDVTLVALEGSTCPVPTKEIFTGSNSFASRSVPKEVSYVLAAYEGLVGKVDIVHDNSNFGPIYARAFPELTIVRTVHAPFEGVLNVICSKIAAWVSAFVAISESQSRTAPVPTTVIHHGVDTERLAFGDGQGDKQGEYLLFLARMQSIKGTHIAARVARENGKRLVIAAKMQEPAEFEYFEKEVEPLLGDGIEFVGEVGGDEKIHLLQGASALLNPIQWPEPFGLNMTEALSCGTPVLAFNRGSVPEIIDPGITGFICEDEDDLSMAVRNIEQLNRENCRKSATEYFNIERMTHDYIKLYNKALDAR